jgi:uncharacterized protein (TIGR04255 family)
MATNEPFDVIPVPLMEAVIEVRFPGEADIERRRGAFQSALRSRYPDLLVPRVAAGESVATSPYIFAAADRSRAVLLSVNLLGYVVQAYPGWAGFRDGFLEHWERLADLVSIQRANRVALRYVNRFAGPLANVVRRLERPAFLVPLSPSVHWYEGSTRMTTHLGHAAHVQVRYEADGGAEADVVLDLDVAREGLDDLTAMSDTLEALHGDVEALFLESIEPQFANSLVAVPEEAR